MRFAIVVSRYYQEISDGLLSGALNCFAEHQIPATRVPLFEAPGSFEIPLIAKRLGESKQFAGITCLGCVIQGETSHYQLISDAISQGLMQASLSTNIPITFGVLCTDNHVQAWARSRPDACNKGREAALACIQAAQTLARIEQWPTESSAS